MPDYPFRNPLSPFGSLEDGINYHHLRSWLVSLLASEELKLCDEKARDERKHPAFIKKIKLSDERQAVYKKLHEIASLMRDKEVRLWEEKFDFIVGSVRHILLPRVDCVSFTDYIKSCTEIIIPNNDVRILEEGLQIASTYLTGVEEGIKETGEYFTRYVMLDELLPCKGKDDLKEGTIFEKFFLRIPEKERNIFIKGLEYEAESMKMLHVDAATPCIDGGRIDQEIQELRIKWHEIEIKFYSLIAQQVKTSQKPPD